MRRAHYLARDPVWGLPLVALVANLILVAYLVVQVHTSRSRVRVTVADSRRPAMTTVAPPVLAVGADGQVALEGQLLVTPLDLEFRLASLATQGAAIVLRTEPRTDAATIARMLQACSMAGFSDVLVEVADSPGGGRRWTDMD